MSAALRPRAAIVGLRGLAMSAAERVLFRRLPPAGFILFARNCGEPAQVAALTRAFRLGTDRRGFCALGSLKSNLGHTDAAAGVAGLMKAALALQHRQLPAPVGFNRSRLRRHLQRRIEKVGRH